MRPAHWAGRPRRNFWRPRFYAVPAAPLVAALHARPLGPLVLVDDRWVRAVRGLCCTSSRKMMNCTVQPPAWEGRHPHEDVTLSGFRALRARQRARPTPPVPSVLAVCVVVRLHACCTVYSGTGTHLDAISVHSMTQSQAPTHGRHCGRVGSMLFEHGVVFAHPQTTEADGRCSRHSVKFHVIQVSYVLLAFPVAPRNRLSSN